MSQENSLQVLEIGHSSRDHPYRHSLQPKGTVLETPLRHTRSQNYKKRGVVTKEPPIPELDSPEDEVRIAVETVNVKVDKERKHSKQSRKASQASSRLAFDNVAFEPDGVRTSRNSSAATSIRSSMRDPSVQSLTVVREQYCCCSRWTPCERALFAAVGVLIFIIIILVIAVILVAIQKNDKDAKTLFKNLFDFGK